MRSDEKKAQRNRACLSELKTLDAKLRKAADDPKQAKEIAAKAVARYDRAVSRGVIPRGRADRKKSRIHAFVTGLSK